MAILQHNVDLPLPTARHLCSFFSFKIRTYATKKTTTTNTAMGIQSQNRNGSIKTMKKKGTQAKKKRSSHSRMVIGGALQFDHQKHCRLCVIYNTKGKEAAKSTKRDTTQNVRIEPSLLVIKATKSIAMSLLVLL